MGAIIYRSVFTLATSACILLLALILTDRSLIERLYGHFTELSNFKTLFLSIILEAFPFVLLGVAVSALLQIFVTEATVKKFTPNNPVLGIIFACLLGVVFPLCECGMIPIVRRLMRKGMPLYIAVVFIVAGPIINPVVFLSTWTAFRGRPEMAYSRMGLAFAAAFAIGLFIYARIKYDPLKAEKHSHSHSHDHGHSHHHHHENKLSGKFSSLLNHASDELFEMGKYLMFGAFITALIQSLVERESMIAIGQGPILSHLYMAGFAYILSICSTSDAFVAASFANSFTTGSLLTFLVFGPMIDFKNTLMLLSVFKKRFVFVLISAVAVTVLSGSILLEKLL